MDHAAFERLLADEPLPAAVIDLDAVAHNTERMLALLGDGPTLRVASKSIRVPWLLRWILERSERLQGLMCFTAREAAFLAGEGFDDLLVAYPPGRPDEARTLAGLAARGVRVLAAVDAPEQVDLLGEAARAAGATLPLCLDVDCSWRPLDAAHLGVRRSPIRDGAAARALGRHVAGQKGVRLAAVLAYEAQVAGMQDHTGSLLDPVRRLIKRRSVPLAAERRAEVVRALRADGHAIDLVNGGGTGSLATTSRDPTVTEVTAGSGFLCPHLFDGYDDLPLRPAAFFALQVVRSSDPGFVTCAGGGYVASGEAGADRLPVVHLPADLQPLDLEGFGEVQTPFLLPPGTSLSLGDPVICRHAKAGELAERFAGYLVVRGGELVHRAPTYRGLGRTFL